MKGADRHKEQRGSVRLKNLSKSWRATFNHRSNLNGGVLAVNVGLHPLRPTRPPLHWDRDPED